MASPISSRLLVAAVFPAALLLPACGGGGGGSGTGSSEASGNFGLLSSTLNEGMTWELNRLMEFEFNNPIDPDTVSFSTVRFSSSEVNQPVTGSFEIKSDGTGRTLVFRPHCPTSQGNDNGSFVPGGYEYLLTIASSSKFGADVLRDVDGRQLTQGVSRTFYSPEAVGGGLFVDYVSGPLQLDVNNPIEWPAGLNLFSDPDSFVRINFNQAIDARPGNLNSRNLYILFADGEVGSVNEDVFPEDNRLPGTLSVGDNCQSDGSTVIFAVAGILPTNRKLKVVIKREFADIAGEENAVDLTTPIYTVPTLAEYFNDSTVAWGSTEVVDEYSNDFTSTADLDLTTGLPLPAADVGDGFMQASFDFPGGFTTLDFLLNSGYSEIFTNSQTFFTDSNNTTFTIQNGVLNCRDFTIEAGSELRGRGDNPLIIYATGDVRIDGRLNVSGNHAVWPTGLNSPQRPEGGAKGECGGGDGGTSSQEVFQETYRGMSGNGAFNFSGQGGQGGESGFNQSSNTTSPYSKQSINNIAAGGGGGTFAITANVSPHWYRWTKDDRMPEIDKNYDADHMLFYDTATDPNLSGTRYPYIAFGGEDGTRGSSWGCLETDPNHPVGIYGMEDEKVDIVLWYADGTPADGQRGFLGGPAERVSVPWADPLNEPNPLTNDPLFTTAIDTFNPNGRILGHPTDGPDGGQAGPTIFSNDGSTANDFWGTRINADGSVTVGELLVPWAGSGGGASGDMVVYNRNGTDPLPDVFPEPNFPNGRINRYRKGAPGGGGGGQVQILAIGDIVVGGAGEIWARGGNAVGGESIGWTYGQVSGSGGGSGGHIILSTASKLDLSAIDILDGSAKGDTNTTAEKGTAYVIPISDVFFTEVFNAVGGRRGWAMSHIQKGEWTEKALDDDGNGTYAIGRGGSGSNGIIQIHVPNPATDIIWPGSRESEIRNYIHDGDIENNDADIDRLEEMLRIFAAPQPVALVPLFSARSMFRSKWIDSGLAELRQPATGKGVDYPDFASSVLSMAGFDAVDGVVSVTNGVVDQLPAVVTGSATGMALFEFEARVANASAAFVGSEHFLRTPNLLLGYVFRPSVSAATSVEVVSASYDSDQDILTLLTEPSDGSMGEISGTTWSLSPRFFRFVTTGASDSMPESTAVRIQFQGAEESAPGSNEPGTPFPDTNSWTSDLSQIEGYRFVRYQITFDIDAQAGGGVDLESPRPQMNYIKLPFTW